MAPSEPTRTKRALVAVLVAGLPLVAACDLVLGLDKYEKVEGGTDAAAADVAVDADASGDAQTLPDAITQGAAWADTRMPNPKFDSGLNANFNTVSYVDVSDGGNVFAVFDATDAGPRRTWLKTSSQTAFKTEEDAQAYCAARSAAIGGDWRLPTRIELVTLIDFTQGGFIDPRFQLNGITRLWTVSAYRPYDPQKGVQYWTVDFGAGRVLESNGPTSNENYGALCVAGKP
jgi:hypothetical protein